MKNTKFVLKVNRNGVFKYVQRINQTPLSMTTNPKLAMAMGRLTAEDTSSPFKLPDASQILSVHVRYGKPETRAERAVPCWAEHIRPGNAVRHELGVPNGTTA